MLFTQSPDQPLQSLAPLVTDPVLSGHPDLAKAADAFLAHAAAGTAAPFDASVPVVWLLQGEAALVDGCNKATLSPEAAEAAEAAEKMPTASSAAAAAAPITNPVHQHEDSSMAQLDTGAITSANGLQKVPNSSGALSGTTAAAMAGTAAAAAAAAASAAPSAGCTSSKSPVLIPPSWVGSTDATTCVIAAVYCPITRLLWCSHLDHLPSHETITALSDTMCHRMRQPRLLIVGGYALPPKNKGPELALKLLEMFHAMPVPVQLVLCCVGARNTDPVSQAPRTRQLLVELVTGEARPWLFGSERGPEVVRRFAAQHVRPHPSKLLDVWDTRSNCFRLAPFDSTLTSWHTFFMERLTAMEDAQLLLKFSSSPLHESDWFCGDMRAMARWLVAAQEPDSEERRAAEGEVRYGWVRAEDGSTLWQRLQPDTQPQPQQKKQKTGKLVAAAAMT